MSINTLTIQCKYHWIKMSWSPLVEQFQAEWSLLTAFIINIVGKYLSSDVMQVRDHPDGWILSRGKRKILTLGVETFSLMVWLPNTYPYWLKNDFLSSIFIVHCTYKCMKLIFLANLQFKLTFTLCMGIHCSSLFFSNELFCADPYFLFSQYMVLITQYTMYFLLLLSEY